MTFKANARRIVAAVNATAGIPTEALEADVVRRMRHMIENLKLSLNSCRLIMSDQESRDLAGSLVKDANDLLKETQ